RRADVVLDQFALGSYGVAACEAMAAGRVVVSHVSDQVRDEVRRSTGTDLPVVQAEAGSLRAVLLRLLDDRDAARDAASRGPELVRRLHDGRAAAAALAPFLGVDPPS
ncbi:MAG: glycosyltransferase family 4 protein, partial [Cellulosimicrobium funkei]